MAERLIFGNRSTCRFAGTCAARLSILTILLPAKAATSKYELCCQLAVLKLAFRNNRGN
jgi:hypothetical protein